MVIFYGVRNTVHAAGHLREAAERYSVIRDRYISSWVWSKMELCKPFTTCLSQVMFFVLVGCGRHRGSLASDGFNGPRTVLILIVVLGTARAKGPLKTGKTTNSDSTGCVFFFFALPFFG